MDIYSTRERIRKENINFMNLPLRVTFYARVSTDFNVQLNSLDNQITYYTDFIRKNPNWEYVDGYVDEGISGVSTAKRERFNEMIEDAKAGMFDLIVTKRYRDLPVTRWTVFALPVNFYQAEWLYIFKMTT